MPTSSGSPFLRRSAIPKKKKTHMIAFFGSGKSEVSCFMDILQPEMVTYMVTYVTKSLAH